MFNRHRPGTIFFVIGENQGMASTQIIIMGGAALGGLWFPFDVHLNFAQRIGLFTPQYWALTVFQDIMLR